MTTVLRSPVFILLLSSFSSLPATAAIREQVMERSLYTRRSGESSGGRDLRFQYEFCNCKKLASLRIVRSNANPRKGKLYFVCERKDCQFFRWCEPIDSIEDDDDVANSSPSSGETETDRLGLILTAIEENNQAMKKLRSVFMYGLGFLVVMLVCILQLK